MKRDDEEHTPHFTTQSAWLGFVAYVVLVCLLAAVFFFG